NLIETIAHELAHAVINSTKLYYRGDEHKILKDGEEIDEGGHGILHHYKEAVESFRKIQEEQKKLIEKTENKLAQKLGMKSEKDIE
ncbi:5972_t:CDS:2, partial [Funneliformis geosporum]